MPRKLEYDFPVQRLNRATGAGFALVLFALVLLRFAAVFHRKRASQRHACLRDFARIWRPSSQWCCAERDLSRTTRLHSGRSDLLLQGHVPTANPNLDPSELSPPSSQWRDAAVGWRGYAVPYYGYYNSEDRLPTTPPDDQYNGGPTVFDRRGPGTRPHPLHIPAAPATTTRSPNQRPTQLAQPDIAPARISLRPCWYSKTVIKSKSRTTQLLAARYTT